MQSAAEKAHAVKEAKEDKKKATPKKAAGDKKKAAPKKVGCALVEQPWVSVM